MGVCSSKKKKKTLRSVQSSPGSVNKLMLKELKNSCNNVFKKRIIQVYISMLPCGKTNKNRGTHSVQSVQLKSLCKYPTQHRHITIVSCVIGASSGSSVLRLISPGCQHLQTIRLSLVRQGLLTNQSLPPLQHGSSHQL